MREPFPGIPARGRGAALRARACVAIVRGPTLHGLRQHNQTPIRELGTPSKRMDERLGMRSGRGSPGTTTSQGRCDRASWKDLPACGKRPWMRTWPLCPTSPLAVLDALLKAGQEALSGE
jgi:hypothetical protein